MIDDVDPFIGTTTTALPAPDGLAATWWWPKPAVGNTHPGATWPFGMVSASAYSGGYPTGYGAFRRSTEGPPPLLHEQPVASCFTHFQQSGTGAIRKYYNYVRISPMLEPLDDVGRLWPLDDEEARPGYYAATLAERVRCEVTVGPKTAIHRYTFPAAADARIVVDCSHGGLAGPHDETVPLRAELALVGPTAINGTVVMEGVPLSFHIEMTTPDWRSQLWYDRRLVHGGASLRFDSIRPTTLRPFGALARGAIEAGSTVEVAIGFSLRGVEQARANLVASRGPGAGSVPTFDEGRVAATRAWRRHLGAIRPTTAGSASGPGAAGEIQRQVFATAAYHSMIKPCIAADESPFWTNDGPFAFDICTMWDIYRTQLPLVTTLFPRHATELARAMLRICEEEGNLPVGYRMARGADRFFRQGSALAHTFLADLCGLDTAGLIRTGIDWDWALCHMANDLRRQYGEDFLEHGVAHPISHTLDLALGYRCTAQVARSLGDHRLADDHDRVATRWVEAFDETDGLVVDSTFYEGGKWNYSFRLLHDMAARIELAGGDAAFTELLDRFFGFGADPVKQLGPSPDAGEIAAGYALGRFSGVNNEADLDAPWAYHYAGRPDRTADVVHAALTGMFGAGPGGLPGNDDSGALSSWYVWASLGVFPVAGQQIVLLGTPAFEHVEVDIGDHTLEIEAPALVQPEPGRPAQYVRSVEVDGALLDRSWLRTSELHSARTIRFEVGDRPGAWGVDGRPPSISSSGVGHAATRTVRTQP